MTVMMMMTEIKEDTWCGALPSTPANYMAGDEWGIYGSTSVHMKHVCLPWALTEVEKGTIIPFSLETHHEAVVNPMGRQWLRSLSSLVLISDSSRRQEH